MSCINYFGYGLNFELLAGFILGFYGKTSLLDHTAPQKSYMKMKTLKELNSLNFDSFIQTMGNIIEHNPMVNN